MGRKESDTDELVKLAQMRDGGYLTEQEFDRRKKAILNGKSWLRPLFSFRTLTVILLGAYLFLVFHGVSDRGLKSSLGANGVPKCSSQLALDTVAELLRKRGGLEVLDMKDIKTIKREENETSCAGGFVTTQGRATIFYRISRGSERASAPFIVEVLNNRAMLDWQFLLEDLKQ